MSGKGLPIIEEKSPRERFEEQVRLTCEKLWTEKEPTILDTERMRRISQTLTNLSLTGKKIADLGCGTAPYPLQGNDVTGVDVAQTALDRCPGYIKRVQGCLPYVRLREESFDLVLLADVITEIEPHLYRLLLSEASELMKRDAICLCSTELDYHSEDPLGHFLALLKTEFEILEIRESYHRLYIALRALLDAPDSFVRASKDSTLRLQQIEKRKGLSRFWFYLNSVKWLAYLWRPLTPLKKRLHNRPLLLILEKISETIWNQSALSHVIVLCKRKSLHQQQ